MHPKIAGLVSGLFTGNIAGLIHRARLGLGLRGLVPRPPFLPSQYEHGNGSVTRVSGADNDGPIKLLAFSHNLSLEGATISAQELICELAQRESVKAEIISFQDGPLRRVYEAHGISVRVLPDVLRNLSTKRRLDSEVARLASVIHASGVEIVLANTLLNFPAILAAEQSGVPSVWIPRESEPWERYFRFLPDPVAKCAIAAVWLPYRVVFVAHATRKVWENLDVCSNFEVIHNGINPARFSCRRNVTERADSRITLGLDSNTIAILCVGTLCSRKNQRDLIEAVASLPGAIISRLQVLLVGDDRGSYASTVKARCRSLPLSVSSRIRFFPPTEAIERFYAAADIHVLCSKVESFPRVILESMTFGLPVITTPVFGVLEQVAEGENALFYSPGDHHMFARQIGRLVGDDSLRGCFSQNSLQRISTLTTFEQMVESYAGIFRAAARRPRQAGNQNEDRVTTRG